MRASVFRFDRFDRVDQDERKEQSWRREMGEEMDCGAPKWTQVVGMAHEEGTRHWMKGLMAMIQF